MEATVELHGARIWYERHGVGPVVFQLHGGAAGHGNFAPVTPILARRFTVIDFDMRGYGFSDRPVQEYDLDVWADDLAGLMSALGIKRAHVHGTSMGGSVAIAFAAKYPERIQRLVINCAAAKLGHLCRLMFGTCMQLARLDPDGMASRALAELVAWQAYSKTFLERPDIEDIIERSRLNRGQVNTLAVYLAACEAQREMDLRESLARISAPTLVIGGEEDILTPWDQGPGGVGQQGIYEGIAGAEKHVLPAVGHVTIAEAPNEYAEIVGNFLERH